MSNQNTVSKKSTFFIIYQQKLLYLMVLPAFLLTLVFSYIPLAGWIMAFQNYRVEKGVFASEFVGLRQFQRFFLEGNDYAYLIKNTLGMNILSLIIGMLASVLFAILVKEIKSKVFSKTIQSVTFFPFFISMVIVYAIMHALFASSSGAVNETLINLGVIEEGINLLGDKKYSWFIIITSGLWKSLGYNSVIYLAAIAGIPSEQYESAEIDGAGRFGKIIHITIPNLLPTITVLLIMNSGWILSSNLDQYFVFTNPTNWETMEVFDMYIYKYGFKLFNVSYATAVGIMKSMVSLLLLFGVNCLSKKVNDKSIF